MKNYLVFLPALLTVFMLPACTPATPHIKPAPIESSPVENSGVVRFSDILSQYQNLNTRLENVAARLRLSSTALCPVTIRDGGFSVHTLADYPERLRPVAQTFLTIDDGLYIRSLRVESPAARAGMQLGDRIMGINNQHIPSGETQRKFYRLATEKAFSADKASLTIARGKPSDGKVAGDTAVLTFELSPQTLCGYPAHVVFDEAVNGHTDGEAVWITSALMRAITDDSALALIVAHEMAHAISTDTPQSASRNSELKADRMALILMARAGFNIEAIERHWGTVDAARTQHRENSNTHPSRDERRENFAQSLSRIQQAQKSRQALDFSIFEN